MIFSKTNNRISLHSGFIVALATVILLSCLPKAYASPNNTKMVDACVVKIEHGSSPVQRMQAVHELANFSSQLSSNLVHSLSYCLMSDPDPDVRSAIAQCFAEFGSDQKHSPAIGLRCPQIVTVLTVAYEREQNAFVRQSIIMAACEFDDPEAAVLINKALRDQDPAVRETATRSKLRRNTRQSNAVTG